MSSMSAITGSQPQSVYPLPPMRYISGLTDENLLANVCPSPPKPITDGQYSMFGQTIAIDDHIIRSLESQGLRRLYPREYDHKRELKKINSSILVNFLDILDVLVRCPDTNKREDKQTDIQLLFITMHHLINELRPHQARESIRVLLQSQKRQRFETSVRLNKQIERVVDLINSAINSITDHNIDDTIDVKLDKNDRTVTSADGSAPTDNCRDSSSAAIDYNYQLDCLMCEFVDDM